MLSFEKIFDNWFDDPTISFQELEAGTRDHLDRLRQGNEQGRFEALITATDTRYTAYFGQRTQAATAQSTGKGTTLTLSGAIAEMVAWLVADGREYIRYKLKADADRLRFFPGGNDEYHQAKQGEWPLLLERLDTAFLDLGAGFDADIKKAYVDRRKAVLDALTTQAGQKKAKSDATVGSQAEREKLTLQLSRNARTLGLLFDEYPGTAITYFDKKYFGQLRHGPGGAPAATPPAH